jgi:aminoglycoside 6'-N-acetyltransferase I
MQPPFTIRLAQSRDRVSLARMRALLWPDASVEEHAAELNSILSGHHGTLPTAMFVAETADGQTVGFLEAGLRSHADGCDPAHAVGYVEGWYVEEQWRSRGIGKALLAAAENWARGQGCREMASDTWIDNQESQRVHEALGFQVVDGCVNYRKQLC